MTVRHDNAERTTPAIRLDVASATATADRPGSRKLLQQVRETMERQRGYPVDYPKIKALCRQAGLKICDLYEPGVLPRPVVSEGTIKNWRTGGYASIDSLKKLAVVLSDRLGWKVHWRELTLTRTKVLTRSRRIAVLPFHAQGVESDSRDVAAGFRVSIITQLSKLHGLRVLSSIAARSAAEGKPRNGHVNGFRRSGVHAVLTGTMRAKEETARLDLELADTATGEVLWAQSFLFGERELLETQTAIAVEVANQIGRTLSA